MDDRAKRRTGSTVRMADGERREDGGRGNPAGRSLSARTGLRTHSEGRGTPLSLRMPMGSLQDFSTASRKCFDGLKTGTSRGGTWTASPVRGFLAIRDFR